MKLTLEGLEKDIPQWEAGGYQLPKHDIEKVRDATLASPVWVHFGSGNIARGYLAMLQQRLLDAGHSDRGMIICSSWDEEVVDGVFRPHDNLNVAVSLHADGSVDKQVLASVAAYIKTNSELPELLRIFENPSLQMASLAATEKAYSLRDASGGYAPALASALEAPPRQPGHLMVLIAFLLYRRYLAGAAPLALVSMDNFSHNGLKLFNSVHEIAESWVKAGSVEKAFLEYIGDPARVSFPWSMIDRIVPKPSEQVREMLIADGYESGDIITTAKGSKATTFVNLEEAEYLVIEDSFPNGRPALDKAGVIFTDRDTVDKVETMKVCTGLNPLHTTLAIFGCLLGYDRIYKEMKNPLLRRFVTRLAYDEGLPVAAHPGIIDPEEFVHEVLTKRFPNPFVPDMPQRIAWDTSQKVPVRFGVTLKTYAARGADALEGLVYIPLFIAGWLRYLLGVDDEGNPFEISPDPLGPVLQAKLAGIPLGDSGPYTENLKPILSDEKLFGIDLLESGLADKISVMFGEMVKGPGAVTRTLEKYCRE
ncbi:mannitol dehydrogenase family protein [Marispirochaeta aestuarii]|uniref:mannitol dehydrogenase family protein n=1 Tax=Marispirochaeta aestuarii TaxID=1963862 RepID=UPI0029C81C6C|nr:mannitol dehydrogenase family protein [Marispirochaeta aestuarii]